MGAKGLGEGREPGVLGGRQHMDGSGDVGSGVYWCTTKCGEYWVQTKLSCAKLGCARLC